MGDAPEPRPAGDVREALIARLARRIHRQRERLHWFEELMERGHNRFGAFALYKAYKAEAQRRSTAIRTLTAERDAARAEVEALKEMLSRSPRKPKRGDRPCLTGTGCSLHLVKNTPTKHGSRWAIYAPPAPPSQEPAMTDPEKIARLTTAISQAWQEAMAEYGLRDHRWTGHGFEVFRHDDDLEFVVLSRFEDEDDAVEGLHFARCQHIAKAVVAALRPAPESAED